MLKRLHNKLGFYAGTAEISGALCLVSFRNIYNTINNLLGKPFHSTHKEKISRVLQENVTLLVFQAFTHQSFKVDCHLYSTTGIRWKS
ncbi:hypothetical protein R545_22430 [Salmonella enterica subsp. diarizonae serovar Rough:r:z]|uniref:Uncharacterized protein n=3 Tax=Salmonella enterica TaxID=28901 RepID=A0A7Z1PQ19_SALET|nr:hypothetical protein [Salmonella enterica]OSG80334.1 hypothetical protein R545_22430 [Salmonella enterica subsp. diarizonae serovar Rough:r:z]PTU38597.1 hypothetical protein DBZ43_00360 [Salmonella enterica subsp. enterica]EAA9928411.1 hypothetical protein [Salmonella enterica]EAO9250963.1 hypothetical protein [Salmonella enterica]